MGQENFTGMGIAFTIFMLRFLMDRLIEMSKPEQSKLS